MSISLNFSVRLNLILCLFRLNNKSFSVFEELHLMFEKGKGIIFLFAKPINQNPPSIDGPITISLFLRHSKDNFIDDIVIEQKTHTKFLGVVINENLNGPTM